MSEGFVNRHGHQVSGSLEEAPAQEPTPIKPQATPKVPKVKKARSNKPIKKILTIVLLIIAALTFLPLATGESVRANYLSSRDKAKAQLIEFASKTVVPQQKKQVTLTQISEAAVQVEKIRDDLCDGGIMDNLAMLYPRAEEAYEQCTVFRQKVVGVAAGLRDMESQVRYLETLSPIIEPVAKSANEGFAVISAQHENWKTLHDALDKLSPAASQRTVHEKIKLETKAIVEAWSALNAANNNQNAEAFSAAEKKLSENYEAFRSAAAGLSAVMNDTQTSLTTAYKAL